MNHLSLSICVFSLILANFSITLASKPVVSQYTIRGDLNNQGDLFVKEYMSIVHEGISKQNFHQIYRK